MNATEKVLAEVAGGSAMTQLQLFTCVCGEPMETGPHSPACPDTQEDLGGYECGIPGPANNGCGALSARTPGELCGYCQADLDARLGRVAA